MKEYDLVYPVREGEHNFDLLYSLRSVYANTHYGKIWITGYKPAWVKGDVGYIPTTQDGTKWRNALNNIVRACLHEKISEDFVLMNDDFFCVKPFTFTEDSLYWRKPTSVWDARERYRFAKKTSWYRMFFHMAALLNSMGIKTHYDFTLHKPMMINKRLFLHMMDQPLVKWYLTKGWVFSYRILYGNMFLRDGQVPCPVQDEKLHKGRDMKPDATWVSVEDGHTDNLETSPVLRRALRGLPPSPYEDRPVFPDSMKISPNLNMYQRLDFFDESP